MNEERRPPPTLAELRAAHPPVPPRGPATEAQKQGLRRRLNERPGMGLNAADHEAFYTLGVVRYDQDVDALVRAVGNESLDTDAASRTRHYAAGILDAVAWARGQQRQAPVTGTPAKGERASTGEMSGEATDAGEVLQGMRSSPHPNRYVVGVESTLLWLLCTSDAHPWNP